MDEIINEDYNKNVNLTKNGRKFRITTDNRDQVWPKIKRYKEERLGEADMGCNHFENKMKIVVRNAG